MFAEDLRDYVARAKKLIPKFNEFTISVQATLVDMAYRGDLGDSPKMRALLNRGEIRKAADEYINRKEYQTARTRGMGGVKTRMDSNRGRLLDYAVSLERKQQ